MSLLLSLVMFGGILLVDIILPNSNILSLIVKILVGVIIYFLSSKIGRISGNAPGRWSRGWRKDI